MDDAADVGADKSGSRCGGGEAGVGGANGGRGGGAMASGRVLWRGAAQRGGRCCARSGAVVELRGGGCCPMRWWGGLWGRGEDAAQARQKGSAAFTAAHCLHGTVARHQRAALFQKPPIPATNIALHSFPLLPMFQPSPRKPNLRHLLLHVCLLSFPAPTLLLPSPPRMHTACRKINRVPHSASSWIYVQNKFPPPPCAIYLHCMATTYFYLKACTTGGLSHPLVATTSTSSVRF